MHDDRQGEGSERLWREAARRLYLVDREPVLTFDEVDALRARLGPRREGEDLRAWLQRGQASADARPDEAIPSVNPTIIPFDPVRQRFRPVAEITRLAADTGDGTPGLPERDLETEDGRFRLSVSQEGAEIVIRLATLGDASTEFADTIVGLAAARSEEPPVVLMVLDEDGDGVVRLADGTTLRRALLRPAIGIIEEREPGPGGGVDDGDSTDRSHPDRPTR